MKKSILQQMSEGNEKTSNVGGEPILKAPRSRRMGSPVVGNVGKALTSLTADAIISINPNKIEPSPFRDRFESDEEALEALQELKTSLKTEGQKIAVLVRPHPTESGRYQLAYGHRRTAALKELHAEAENPETVRVRAYVRDLTDAELAKEQSLENSAREALSFIELAVWARQLKGIGMNNRAMAPILGVPETGVSRLLTISEAIPDDIARAIGRAKESGRRRWAALADALKDEKSQKRVRAILESDGFRKADGDARITLAINAAKGKRGKAENTEKPKVFDLEMDGAVFAKIRKSSANVTTVTIPKGETEFARWLTENLKDFRAQYLAGTEKKPE